MSLNLDVPSPRHLVGTDRHSAMGVLNKWYDVVDRDAIHKVFHFADFSEAWAFTSRVALLAEKMDHHPEIFIVYNRVEITLATGEVDGLTDQDIFFAHHLDEMAPERDL